MAKHIGSVTQLYRYPVKSMQGESCEHLAIHQGGVQGDRAIALQDVKTGKLVTAKQPVLWKAMLLLQAHTQDDGNLKLTLPSGQQMLATDKQAEELLSDYLGRSITILHKRTDSLELERADPDEVVEHGVEHTVNFETMTAGAGAPDAGFVDYGPVHLIAKSSLEAVGHHALTGKSEPERFRANIIINTDDQTPFCENQWIGNTLCIGEHVQLNITLPTPRCAVPTLEQPGLSSDTTFLSHLKQNNTQPFLEGKQLPSLGVYADVVSPGKIRQGDVVTG